MKSWSAFVLAIAVASTLATLSLLFLNRIGRRTADPLGSALVAGLSAGGAIWLSRGDEEGHGVLLYVAGAAVMVALAGFSLVADDDEVEHG